MVAPSGGIDPGALRRRVIRRTTRAPKYAVTRAVTDPAARSGYATSRVSSVVPARDIPTRPRGLSGLSPLSRGAPGAEFQAGPARNPQLFMNRPGGGADRLFRTDRRGGRQWRTPL
ncbi:hypothetical protein Pen02_30710 [Plantactinospora endophytica]|uniref:Uncharacterized protein n=1 Tax=Plantactinospora endophytica TaxID=673535 RepID=A0ABQ4E0A1_9ACTN|nr:hypothetical protein Pen02_30710 [Plantactinospora endophytica]